jgi:spore germination protein YaaH
VGDKAAADYVALVNLTAQTLQDAVPGATVSVDVPWSPFDVDGRNYDWAGLAAAADTVFVMAYDTASQVSGTFRLLGSSGVGSQLCICLAAYTNYASSAACIST